MMSVTISEDLAGIEQVLRVDRALDQPHHVDRVAQFLDQPVLLAEADAVLAGAGAVHRERALDQLVVDRLDLVPSRAAFGSIEKITWKLPSPTWPRIVRDGADVARSFLVSPMHSASRLIGTQTSVVQPTAPGRRLTAA
jgi:hypothetical protein